ncbi:hypothetical protein [Reyranella sp.]|uniref:hypothetical protein n=1 Tax=Reyranella sp. TaxID=1929291 RepID=UPI003D12FCF6
MIDLNTATYPPAPPVHYDLDVIVARLRATAETWVPRHFRHGRRVGDEWRLANIRGDAPRKGGSCVIALKGERAGDWHEFDGGEGGGPLSALEASEKLTGRELFAYAAELVGWVPNIPARVGQYQLRPKPSATHRVRLPSSWSTRSRSPAHRRPPTWHRAASSPLGCTTFWPTMI